MAEKEKSMNMPGSYGGLMRYNEEYPSKLNLKPTHVILFVIAVIAVRVLLGVFL
ncbi:preprotein translocase subunit Sec61beta [Candidatus Pacearchaeota archaeon]|nr:preprotein translocase subunit Sec61beta [Candidatus Pacearchaeota archaeon]